MRAFRTRLAPVLLALLLGACDAPDLLSYPPQVRGNKVEDDDLAQLVVGTSTKQDATALLGSPTAKGSFDDNTWIYAAQITRPEIAGHQAIEDQRVVVLTFDAKGVLRGLHKAAQADALPVDVVSRSTPSPGTEATVLQQLLGNVGRFNAGGASAGSQGNGTTSGNF